MKEKYNHSATPTAKKKTHETGESSTPTALEWSLKRVFKLKSEFGYFYPKIVQLAEVTLSASIANAWLDLPQVYFQRVHGRHTALREIYLLDPSKKTWGNILVGLHCHEYY